MTNSDDSAQPTPQERPAALIVNTFSRRGAASFDLARTLLAQRGITLDAAYPLPDPRLLGETVQQVIEQGHKLVIVGGGDGTISSVVDYFANRDVVLGVLPLGTGNSFARTLGLPLSLAGAVDVIAGGKVAAVDLGKVNDDYFANVVTIGMSADVARTITADSKRMLGPMAYGLGMVQHFYSQQPFLCRLTTQEQRYEVHTYLVIAENGSLFGTTPFTPRTLLDDQSLFVLTTDTASHWQTLQVWGSFLFRQSQAFPQTRSFSTQEVLIETDPPQWVDVDGEITVQTPVRLALAPGALKVMAPLGFQGVKPLIRSID